MSKKKTSILNILSAALTALLVLLISFPAVILITTFIVGFGLADYYQALLLTSASILLLVFVIVIRIKRVSDPSEFTTQDTNEIRQEIAQKKQVSIHSVTNDEIKNYQQEQMAKYRKMYNLPDDTLLYNIGKIYSEYPMEANRLEKRVAKYLINDNMFSPNCIFLDAYFKNKNGKTSQIDIIAVGKRGVFVFEVKDYSGWIFGNGGQTMWTQTLYRNKYHFYNPIRQNKNHISTLKSLLGDGVKFYSLIVFGGEATIKDVSLIPKDTYVLTEFRISEPIMGICNKQPECMSAHEVLEVCRKINKLRLAPDDVLRKNHIKEIKDQTGETRLYS